MINLIIQNIVWTTYEVLPRRIVIPFLLGRCGQKAYKIAAMKNKCYLSIDLHLEYIKQNIGENSTPIKVFLSGAPRVGKSILASQLKKSIPDVGIIRSDKLKDKILKNKTINERKKIKEYYIKRILSLPCSVIVEGDEFVIDHYTNIAGSSDKQPVVNMSYIDYIMQHNNCNCYLLIHSDNEKAVINAINRYAQGRKCWTKALDKKTFRHALNNIMNLSRELKYKAKIHCIDYKVINLNKFESELKKITDNICKRVIEMSK